MRGSEVGNHLMPLLLIFKWVIFPSVSSLLLSPFVYFFPLPSFHFTCCHSFLSMVQSYSFLTTSRTFPLSCPVLWYFIPFPQTTDDFFLFSCFWFTFPSAVTLTFPTCHLFPMFLRLAFPLPSLRIPLLHHILWLFRSVGVIDMVLGAQVGRCWLCGLWFNYYLAGWSYNGRCFGMTIVEQIDPLVFMNIL